MPLSLAPSVMLKPSITAESATAQIEANKSTNALPADPLPTDPYGQRFCEIFGQYLYCSIYADATEDATAKPKWYTQRRYKLKHRVLYRDWQDPEKLIGVRTGHTTAYALLDIDIESPYHPRQDASAIARIEAILETIGITRTLCIRSSWSEGIHLYIPLPEPVKTFDFAVALKNCLEPQGFKLKQGQLECFPNVKAYGNIIKTEYLAHRLPLQPASGSCLLDEAFNPSSSQLADFLNQWDIAAAGQDIQTLRQALPLARKNRFKKVRNRLGKVESWKRDLETVIAEGWSGPSQTNQLLKEIGCYGHVFLGHTGEALVDFIYQQAISSPGYEKWCRHQREIRMRSRVWATAIEKYYWPIGSYGKARKTIASTTAAAVNDLRAQSAQESIRAAMQQLETAGNLPQRVTARAEAIRKAQASLSSTSSSLETLYKAENKKLWHPDYYLLNCDLNEQSPEENDTLPVIPPVTKTSSVQKADMLPSVEPLENSEDGKLRTEEEIMKCESNEHDVLASAKTKFYSGRGVRGDFPSFPQTQRKPEPSKPTLGCTTQTGKKEVLSSKDVASTRHPEKPRPKLKKISPGLHTSATILTEERNTRPRKGISQAAADTITATQFIVQKLGWSIEQVKELVAEKFQGRRRSQLSDDEAFELLYYLQAQHLKLESYLVPPPLA
ncbi:MAG: hypothetical protein AAF716_03680 [Cyanobacteria bacterium P01_D01_bin.1]